MQLSRRRLQREAIIGQGGSFAAREHRVTCFPFHWHYHPELELTLIAKGAGLRFVGDSVQEYRDGDLCLLGANLPHSWSSTPVAGERVHSVVIQFLPEFFGDTWLKLPEMKPIAALFERSGRGLQFTGKTAIAVAGSMQSLCRLPFSSPRRAAELLGILAALAECDECQALSMTAQRPAVAMKVRRRLGAVLDAIHVDPSQVPLQSHAAATAGMSPASFSRFFRRELGKPYNAYVMDVRIARACRRLVETDAPITEIAFDVGFNNLSNFNRQFLSTKGLTPSAYRRLQSSL